MSHSAPGWAARPRLVEHGLTVLAILSLAMMMGRLLLLRPDGEPAILLGFFDDFVCFVFALDFVGQLGAASRQRRIGRYLFSDALFDLIEAGSWRGWRERHWRPVRAEYGTSAAFYLMPFGLIDLLSSIPDAVGVVRLARLARVARVAKALKSIALIGEEIRENRREGLFVVALLVVMVSVIFACVSVLYFESSHPDATIRSAPDALWWALVTVTTVGYGDFSPRTVGGRLSAVLLMFVGIGLFAGVSGIVVDSLRRLKAGPARGAGAPAHAAAAAEIRTFGEALDALEELAHRPETHRDELRREILAIHHGLERLLGRDPS